MCVCGAGGGAGGVLIGQSTHHRHAVGDAIGFNGVCCGAVCLLHRRDQEVLSLPGVAPPAASSLGND